MAEPVGPRDAGGSTDRVGEARILLGYATERRCVLRSLKVALVVGTVLAILNHFDALLSGTLGPLAAFQIGITYTVPYLVATFGSVMEERALRLERT